MSESEKSSIIDPLLRFAHNLGKAHLVLPEQSEVLHVVEPVPPALPLKIFNPGSARSASYAPGGGLPPIRSLGEWTDPGPVPDTLVDGVLGRGMKMVLGGGSKTYKTWNLMTLGLAVACGKSWLGFNCRRGRVLYVNLELMEAFCHRRLMDIRSAMGLSHHDVSDLHVWNLRGHAMEIVDFIDEIEPILVELGYSLIIFDPIYKLLGDLSENSAEDVAKVMNALDRLAVRCNAAVVIAHHFSKGNQSRKEAIDRVSGSGVWARDPDALLMITRHKDDDNLFTASAILRNYPPVGEFVLRWEAPIMRRCEDIAPQQLRSHLRTAKFPPERVLAVLTKAGAGGLPTVEWQTACENELGMPASTFYTKMKSLLISGEIENRDGRNVAVGGGNTTPPPGAGEGDSNSKLESN